MLFSFSFLSVSFHNFFFLFFFSTLFLLLQYVWTSPLEYKWMIKFTMNGMQQTWDAVIFHLPFQSISNVILTFIGFQRPFISFIFDFSFCFLFFSFHFFFSFRVFWRTIETFRFYRSISTFKKPRDNTAWYPICIIIFSISFCNRLECMLSF